MAFTSIGYDGSVNERQWAELVPSVGSSTYGVKGAGDLKVSAVPGQPLMVSVSAGSAWGHGVLDTETANTTVTCDAITSGSRWDLIALRRDWQPLAGGPTSVVKVTGTSDKVLPGSRQATPGVVDDQPLALVQWTAGQTQPTAIVDLRCWAGNGGLYAKSDLVRVYMDKIGTEINISGVDWLCVLADNDMKTWRQASEIESTVVKPSDVPWRHFTALISAPGGTDGNGYGELRFGQNGLPAFVGLAGIQLTGFHPVDTFMFAPVIQDYNTTRIRFRARRLDNSGWASGYGSISVFVTVVGW